MNIEKNYLEINRYSWNNRLEAHVKSDFYNLDNFLNGETSLNSIELELLGNIKGKSILHLQCHFGQDSISLSRLGADVTGVDLSDKAIDFARSLVEKLEINTQFVCCDIYDLPNYLDEKFDIVFTSYGTITWLPDLDKWGDIISRFLKPKGKFVFVEFHPFVWMFDDSFDKVQYHYFNIEAIVETENGTYANKNAEITQSYVAWNHSMSEVMMSLLNHSMEIVNIQEYDYLPYNVFEDMIEFESKKFRISKIEYKIPMLYSIIAEKE